MELQLGNAGSHKLPVSNKQDMAVNGWQLVESGMDGAETHLTNARKYRPAETRIFLFFELLFF